jgi:putative ABC transport system permease protein
LRDYDLRDADASIIDDPLVFLAQPDSLMVTTEFAERNGIKVNSKIPLISIEGEKQFTVRGIMGSQGLAQAFGGNLAVMDIYAAQHVFGRGRRFDRIDLRAKDGVSLVECQAAITRTLGPGFEVDTPSARGRNFENLMRSYSMALSTSSLLALIVGMFIIYNSFAIAVTHRRSEIGILRALGATRGQIQNLFLVEGFIAGLAGSALGAVLGLAAATAIARYLSALLERVGGVAQRVTELQMDPSLIATAMVIGIGTSTIAAWIPARSASRVDPVQALQKGKYQLLSEGDNRQRRRFAFGFVIVGCLCLLIGDSNPVFYTGYILMILAGLLLAPLLTLLLAKALRPILKRILPVEGVLAADSLIQSPRRTSATVSALMLSIAMVLGFGGFAHSYYVAIDDWFTTVLNPDLFVSPTANLTLRSMTFPGQIGPFIEAVEGVDQVQLVRNARLLFRNKPVMLISIETDKAAKQMHRMPVAGSLDEMYRLTFAGEGVIASESFSIIHKMKVGDLVELPTPSGSLRLPIVGTVRDYSDMNGALFIDRSLYSKWWKDDTANLARVYVKKGESVAMVRQRVIDALAGRQHLLVLTNHEVRDWVMKIIDQWLSLTYNQIAVAMLVAVLGIVNTLTVSITDRRRELGVMRAVGGFRNQIRRTIWIEAISIGVIGLILGVGWGAVNLYYMLGIVKSDTFGGIELNYVFPVPLALFMIPTILAAAFVAAVGPGESAVRGTLVEALEYE